MPNPRSKRLTIDLPVNSTYPGNKIQFPDVPELRSDSDKDVCLWSFQTYHDTIVPNTFNGNPVATFAQLQNAVLTLYVIGVEQQFNIPLPRLINMQSNDSSDTSWFSREPFNFSPLRVDWTKSVVQACTGTLAGETSYSFYFEVEYEWLPVGAIGNYLENQRNRWLAGNLKD